MTDTPVPPSFTLTGGSVVDGTGRPAFRADVTVDHGRIQVVEPGSATGHRVAIDGLTVAPGFIDTHAHADLQAVRWGDDPVIQASRLRQGVTTEITGNCGSTPFPTPPEASATGGALVQSIMGPGAPTFPDLDTYAEAVTAARPATNVAPLVGHHAVRAGTLGFENRPATPDELRTMQDRVRAAMAAGAFGFSTGLVYTPGTYAPPHEVAAIVAVLAETGGIYATHIRNESDGVAGAVREAIDAAQGAGVPLHISHLKVAGRSQWGTADDILALIDGARAGGADVTVDVYPYTRASTSLHSTLPPWTAEGGLAAMLERLGDPDQRARAHRDMVSGIPGWQNLGTAAGWDRVWIASAVARPDWIGRTIAELAEPDDRSPVDTIARVLIATGSEAKIVLEIMDEADMRRFLGWDHTMIGSDGIPVPGRPHPRVSGTFPRVLGRYRDVFGSFEEAVHRMTGRSAERFALPGRGRVADGLVADLVVLDPDTVTDGATYEDPWAPPVGIHHVFMAGTAGVWDGEVVDLHAGRLLRRGGRQ